MVARVKRPGTKQRTGAFGEEVTAQYLLARGDEILDRNWRIREGEIDLVSLGSDGSFHFIEVKTRSSLAFGHPFEAINREKAHRMQRLAMGWLATHGCLGCEYSIDVVAILIAADGTHTLEYRGNLL
ncbi:COG0792 Predicted endonuclease distantly related to archaeal Holliday junction resolvase [Candidatus Nanopelagicaceae bacterium]